MLCSVVVQWRVMLLYVVNVVNCSCSWNTSDV